MPAKRPTFSLLFRCLLCSAFTSVSLVALAENAGVSASAGHAPITTATRVPVTESAPTLPIAPFGAELWRQIVEIASPIIPGDATTTPTPLIELKTPIAPVVLPAPASPFSLVVPTAPAQPTTPPARLISPVAGTPSAQVIPMAPLQESAPLGALGTPGTLSTLGTIAEPAPTLEIHDDFPRIAGIDLTTPPNDLWQRMRNGFSMANLDSPLVADRQAWYLNRPELLKSVLNRSRRYLFYIVGELEKRGMPTELALLPMVESSYNPMAYSPAHASGLWQFIPSTGKNYRLEQNWWHDQRRDIIASTGAALDYLQNIYEMHGDWHLALASYNWGEAAVGRAVAKNKAKHLPTDYAHINMPQETRYYVPKLQALKNIIAQPQLFGIKIDPIPNQPYFDTVDKTSNMDVSLAAKLAEVPLDEFLALNPSYNRPVMPGSKTTPLVLPAGKVQTFLTNLQSHEAQEKPLSNWSTYTLKKGERLDKVAARFHMTAARLKQINGIGGRAHIRAGNTLLVPGKGAQMRDSVAEMNLNPPETAHSDAPRGKGKVKVKQAGKRGVDSGKATKAQAAAGRSVKKGKPTKHTARIGAKRSGKASGGKKRQKR